MHHFALDLTDSEQENCWGWVEGGGAGGGGGWGAVLDVEACSHMLV